MTFAYLTGPTDLCSTAAHLTLLNLSIQVLFEYLLLLPKSAFAAAPAGLTSKSLCSLQWPSYSSRRGTLGVCIAATEWYKPKSPAPSSFRTIWFSWSVVTNALVDSDFHGHLPAVYINQHVLWYLKSVLISGALKAHLVHPTAPVMLIKSCPLGTRICCKVPIKQVELFKVWGQVEDVSSPLNIHFTGFKNIWSTCSLHKMHQLCQVFTLKFLLPT